TVRFILAARLASASSLVFSVSMRSMATSVGSRSMVTATVRRTSGVWRRSGARKLTPTGVIGHSLTQAVAWHQGARVEDSRVFAWRYVGSVASSSAGQALGLDRKST